MHNDIFSSKLIHSRFIFQKLFSKQLSKYYHKCVRAGLLQRWASIVSEGEGESAKVWIGQFYTELLARLQKHHVWVAQVFPVEQPGHLLAQLVASVLASVNLPPQNGRVVLKGHGGCELSLFNISGRGRPHASKCSGCMSKHKRARRTRQRMW